LDTNNENEEQASFLTALPQCLQSSVIVVMVSHNSPTALGMWPAASNHTWEQRNLLFH